MNGAVGNIAKVFGEFGSQVTLQNAMLFACCSRSASQNRDFGRHFSVFWMWLAANIEKSRYLAQVDFRTPQKMQYRRPQRFYKRACPHARCDSRQGQQTTWIAERMDSKTRGVANVARRRKCKMQCLARASSYEEALSPPVPRQTQADHRKAP